MKLEQLVNTYYQDLSNNERMVIDFILANKSLIKSATSEEVSKQCNVTRPTLLRTLKKLQIQSYHELKFLLQEEKQSISKDIEIEEITEDYHHMIHDIFIKDYQDICKVLYTARNIYIYGTGNEQKSIGEELKRMLFSLGKGMMDFYDLGEVEFQKKIFSKEDVFIIISLSGETKKALDIIQSIKTTGIQLVSITKLKNNSVARNCYHNLYVGTKTIPIQQKDGYEIMTSFYVLLDALFVQYLQYSRRIKHEI